MWDITWSPATSPSSSSLSSLRPSPAWRRGRTQERWRRSFIKTPTRCRNLWGRRSLRWAESCAASYSYPQPLTSHTGDYNSFARNIHCWLRKIRCGLCQFSKVTNWHNLSRPPLVLTLITCYSNLASLVEGVKSLPRHRNRNLIGWNPHLWSVRQKLFYLSKMKNVSRDEHFLQKIKFYCPPFLYKTRKSNVSYVSVCHQENKLSRDQL